MLTRPHKIIFIQPTYPTSPFGPAQLPVGLGYLAEQLEENDIAYEVCDVSLDGEDSLFYKIEKHKPEFVGISMMSLDVYSHYKLIKKIKLKFPDVKTLAGGPHISFVKQAALEECAYIDLAIVQEGEVAIVELLKGQDLKNIKSLIFKNEVGQVISNEIGPFIQELDAISFPKYRKFKMHLYSSSMQIISSRGCPYSCIFCGAHFSMGKMWRARTAESIIKEIDYWCEKGYTTVSFTDSNFFLNKNRVMDLCERLKEKDLKITMISDGMRADNSDFEMLRKMKESGLFSVAIGVESANDHVLKRTRKGETLSQIENAIKTCISLDIHVILFFIIGLPGETKNDVENSFKLALKYPIQDAYFFNVNPLPKTELFEWAENNNYLLVSKEKIYENIGGMGSIPLIATPELSYDDRRKLYIRGLSVQKKVRRKHAMRMRIRFVNSFFDSLVKRMARQQKYLSR